MGGCRCTYRNCTMRSDGTTHMFHYPVFDKVRCHQWLINAQRLEFLNLKVSQLKNRVVCQHHFKDECFMNFLKERLTFEAVPTEDGPFCDSSQLPQNNSVPEVANVTRNYIEYEYLTTTEKKANFSVKYGDFLTNCDVMDMLNLDPNNDNDINEHNKKPNVKFHFDSNYDGKYFEPDTTNNKKCEQGAVVMSHSKPIGSAFDELPQITRNEIQEIEQNQMVNTNIKPKSKKIKILCEKKISEPVKVVGQFIPVCPSFIIDLPVKKENISFIKNEVDKAQNVASNMCNEKLNATVQDNIMVTHKMAPTINQTDYVVNNVKTHEEINPVRAANRQVVQINNPVSPQRQSREIKGKDILPASNLKSKMAPERVAAIEEKRNFNKKLRDIIESCLENIDDNVKDMNYVKVAKRIRDNRDEGDVLAQRCNPPNLPECTMASLEARLKRMEDTLLNKINQNSEKIADLKNSLPSTSHKRKSCSIVENEEVHKRQLYQEISQYLSKEANSLIYEELFINKFVQKLPSAKKRKKRSFVNVVTML